MKTRISIIVILGLLIAGPVFAEDTVDFSGLWQLHIEWANSAHHTDDCMIGITQQGHAAVIYYEDGAIYHALVIGNKIGWFMRDEPCRPFLVGEYNPNETEVYTMGYIRCADKTDSGDWRMLRIDE